MSAGGDEPRSANPAEPYSRLGDAFDAAVRSALPPGGRCAVLFSGGVDSALVAEAACRFGSPTLITAGLPGSPDLEFVRRLTLPWSVRRELAELSPSEVERAWALVTARFPSASQVERSILTGLTAGIHRAREERVLCGQGADELFLGYAHFRGLPAHDARTRSDSDRARLLDQDWPRSVALARAMAHDLRSPYLDPRFLDCRNEIPLPDLLPDELTKRPLRILARRRGIPATIVERPKKALQYGTGVERWLRRTSATGR